LPALDTRDAAVKGAGRVGIVSSLIDRLFEAAQALPGLRRDEKRKRILRDMLADPRYEWRSIATLARAAGTSEERARELLVSIGARASTGSGRELWGLVSRVGSG
jgi:hypothetical protein